MTVRNSVTVIPVIILICSAMISTVTAQGPFGRGPLGRGPQGRWIGPVAPFPGFPVFPGAPFGPGPVIVRPVPPGFVPGTRLVVPSPPFLMERPLIVPVFPSRGPGRFPPAIAVPGNTMGVYRAGRASYRAASPPNSQFQSAPPSGNGSSDSSGSLNASQPLRPGMVLSDGSIVISVGPSRSSGDSDSASTEGQPDPGDNSILEAETLPLPSPEE